MARKYVTAQDAAIKKILNDPNNEILGDVSYQTANGIYNTYSPNVKQVTGDDEGIKKILSDPRYEILGNVAYKNGDTTYRYQQPEAPSYTQPDTYNRDIASEMNAAASLGEWDKLSSLANERMQKIAQSGGNDGGVATADLVNSLKQQYSKSYGDYQKQQQIQKLLGGNVTTPYDSLYKSLLDQYQKYGFDKFMKSNQYKNLKDMYTANGQNAMKDVLGEVSARTGGLASSYATAAAQGQYDNYMNQLASLAERVYENERGDLRDYLGLVGNRMDTEAQRQMSANANVYNALARIADQEREDAWTEKQWARQDEQTQKAWEREDTQRAEDRQYNKEQQNKTEARNAVIAALTDPMGSHMIEDLDPELVAASGMSWAEMVAAANQGRQAKDEMDWQNEQRDMTREQYELTMGKKTSGGSSGGGGRRRSGSGGGGRRRSGSGKATGGSSGDDKVSIDEYKDNIKYYLENGNSVGDIVKAVDALDIPSEQKNNLKAFTAKTFAKNKLKG